MSGRNARGITGRIYVTGSLVLETPTHLGNGDIVGVTDMPLLRDPRDGVTPLLTGASIAGALRSYLREVEHGYGQSTSQADQTERLFGRLEGKFTLPGWVQIDDSLGESAGIDLRDGVAIDPATRTAEDHKKFDIELLAAGTTFPIQIEFLESDESKDLLAALAIALDGLARGEIGLGQRKRRGLGRCKITEWRVRRYNLTTPSGLIAWLDNQMAGEKRGSDIFDLLGVKSSVADQRNWFQIDATFGLQSSLLIRTGSAEPGSPDVAHLRSLRQGDHYPIISGTSLAGVVRSRALRIANTILGGDKGARLVNGMFGDMDEEITSSDTKLSAADRPKPSSSRVITEESVVKEGRDLVQSRVKIDRFTGGAFPTALFSEQPLFGSGQTCTRLQLTLRNPQDAEIGLLLLVLKDLWAGDLPLGGESSVGRGRLSGQQATLTLHKEGTVQRWNLVQEGDTLRCQEPDGFTQLDSYVTNGLWNIDLSTAKNGRPS